MSGKRPDYFDFKRLLHAPLKRNQLVVDLADVSNEILGREVEEKRRLLERSRDSVRARKGQVISQIDYLPEATKPAYYVDTGEPVDLEPGTRIPKALVRRMISNSAAFNQTPLIDYFELEFKWLGRTCRWLMPQTITQERDLLIKNSLLIGFDYFSEELSDSDYARLYESLSMYWAENGQADFFIQYIGFIKNLRLEAVPLWSKDNGTDLITELEPFNTNTMVKASAGGPWYLTSHVELRYDISQVSNFYKLKTHDLETLFYYFAPIILVLERIVGSLQVDTDVAILSVGDLNITNYSHARTNSDSFTTTGRLALAQTGATNYSLVKTSTNYTDRQGIRLALGGVVQNYGQFTLVEQPDQFRWGVTSLSVVNMYTQVYTILDYMNYGSRSYNQLQLKTLETVNMSFIVVQHYAICQANLI